MRADEIRCVPVDAIVGLTASPSSLSSLSCASSPTTSALVIVAPRGRRILRLARTNALRLARGQVEPRDIAVLRRRINDVRILRIVARLKSVAAADDEPVARPDAPAVRRARRSAHGPVVLRAAAHAIERPRVV